jgi:DNA polymerase-3 subunit chi
MTEVSFHFNTPDKWSYMCRLLRKAVVGGSRVAITGEATLLQRLDADLWTFSAIDFLPHCSDAAEAGMLAASPVVVCASPSASPHHEVLLNLGPDVPVGFEPFERLIEVVGVTDEDRADSRRRWKYYLDRGYAITRHDLASKALH